MSAERVRPRTLHLIHLLPALVLLTAGWVTFGLWGMGAGIMVGRVTSWCATAVLVRRDPTLLRAAD